MSESLAYVRIQRGRHTIYEGLFESLDMALAQSLVLGVASITPLVGMTLEEARDIIVYERYSDDQAAWTVPSDDIDEEYGCLVTVLPVGGWRAEM